MTAGVDCPGSRGVDIDFANLHVHVVSLKKPKRQSDLNVNGVSTIADIGRCFDGTG